MSEQFDRLLENVRAQKAGYGAAFALLLLGAAGAAVFFNTDSAPKPDPANSCLPGTPERHRIVLIDTTDMLGSTQRDVVLNAVDGEAVDTVPFERLTVVAVDGEHPHDPRVVFSACSPKRRSTSMTENPDQLEDAWQSNFRDPLIVAVRTALDAPPQNETPLIESIYGIGRRPDFNSAVPDRRLMIVSDMLQNTAALYSLYSNENVDFAAFAGKPHAFQNVPNLANVAVVGRLLDSNATQCIQGVRLRRFWEQYFLHAGTRITFRDWPWRTESASLPDRCGIGRHGLPGTKRPWRRHHGHRRHSPPPADGRGW